MRAPRSSSVMTPDARSLDAFVGKLVADLGATLHAGMAVLGDQLGLYKALASAPMTSIELATATGTDERYAGMTSPRVLPRSQSSRMPPTRHDSPSRSQR